MLVITALSVFLNVLVVYKAIGFFRHGGECRESDKTVVATLAGLAVMFIIAQVLTWGAGPWMLERGTLGSLFMMAFNFANSFFYLAHISSLTDRKECHIHG
jgi:uncharacterized YccA/Bax inhibitor family protein